MISESTTETVGEFTEFIYFKIKTARQTIYIKSAGSVLDLTKPAFLAMLLVSKCQLTRKLHND